MGVDLKYGQVTVERVRTTPIGEDEPVVVFRAQDQLMPKVLAYYAAQAIRAGSPAEHVQLIQQAHDRVVAWQSANRTQVPGS